MADYSEIGAMLANAIDSIYQARRYDRDYALQQEQERRNKEIFTQNQTDWRKKHAVVDKYKDLGTGLTWDDLAQYEALYELLVGKPFEDEYNRVVALDKDVSGKHQSELSRKNAMIGGEVADHMAQWLKDNSTATEQQARVEEARYKNERANYYHVYDDEDTWIKNGGYAGVTSNPSPASLKRQDFDSWIRSQFPTLSKQINHIDDIDEASNSEQGRIAGYKQIGKVDVAKLPTYGADVNETAKMGGANLNWLTPARQSNNDFTDWKRRDRSAAMTPGRKFGNALNKGTHTLLDFLTP